MGKAVEDGVFANLEEIPHGDSLLRLRRRVVAPHWSGAVSLARLFFPAGTSPPRPVRKKLGLCAALFPSVLAINLL